MPMATLKAKGKLKKRMGRLAKMKIGNKDSRESEASDLSQLRAPIDIGLSSLRQIAQLFEKGTDEVREILTYECDVIYECRICRSLFRSLANMISHKRVYCPEKYGEKRRTYSTDCVDSVYTTKEFSSLWNASKHLEEGVENFSQSFYKNNNNNSSCNCSDEKKLVDVDCNRNSNDRILRSQVARKAAKRDLTSIVDMLTKKQNDDRQYDDVYDEKRSTCPFRISTDNGQVLLEMMDSNQAAYQTVLAPETSTSCDLMKTQTAELKNMSNRSTAVLGPDGKLHEVRSSVTSYGSHDENDDFDFVPNSTHGEDFTCATCNEKFATMKTLQLHVKCGHALFRTVYPCPCCSSVVPNRWSMYRHLFKVHRKSNEQVRRLRSQIQPRVMRIDASRVEGLSKSRVSPRQRITEETEESKGSELDRELQRCGTCGKQFERKTALVAHRQICKARASVGACGKFSRRHKRANKNSPQRIVDLPDDASMVSDRGSVLDEGSIEASSTSFMSDRPEPSKDAAEIAIRVEDVSSLSKDAWDMIENDSVSIVPLSARGGKSNSSAMAISVQADSRATVAEKTSVSETSKSKDPLAIENSDVPEVIYTSIDNSRPVTLSVLNKEKKLGIQYRGIRLPTVTLEKINVSPPCEPALSFSAVELDRKPSTAPPSLRPVKCLPCNRRFVSPLQFQRYNAVHQRRNRYRCKLCDFEAFLKCECTAHCNSKHNARNNRQILSELILEMPLSSDSGRHRGKDGTGKRDQPAEMSKKQRPIERRDEWVLGSENGASASDVEPPRPRRGRPPKGSKRRIVKVKNGLRRARHVSPPTLREDRIESVELDNIANSLESIDRSSAETDVVECSRAASRMDCDPELRKMVMEVIFGSIENQTAGNRENEASVEEAIAVEDLDSKPLNHRLNCELSRLKSAQKEANGRRESGTEKHEDDPKVLGNRNGSSNNARDDQKPPSFRTEPSIARVPLILARKASATNRPVKLQSDDVRCDVMPSSDVQSDFERLSMHEARHLVTYEHDYQKSMDA